MRQIGSFQDERLAQRFGDFLLTQGIKNHVEQASSGAWDVWIEDDDQLDFGKTALEIYRADPDNERYAAAATAAKLRDDMERADERRRKQFVDVRTRWSKPSQLAKPVTIVLIAICLLVAGLTRLGMSQEDTPAENALRIAPVEPAGEGYIEWDDLAAIRHGQIWRVITPIFLHYGPIHLIFNLFWLFDLGSMIESRRSSIFLLIMVLVTAATSNVAEYYLPNPAQPSPLFGGMSGVVYALFGYAWIKGKFQPYLGIGVSQQTVMIMMIWLVVCILGVVRNVANVAHVAGLLGGVAFAYVPYLVTRLRRR